MTILQVSDSSGRVWQTEDVQEAVPGLTDAQANEVLQAFISANTLDELTGQHKACFKDVADMLFNKLRRNDEMISHTPEKWTVEKIDYGHVYSLQIVESGRTIAQMVGHDDDDGSEYDTNAQLIASAPELLKALKSIRFYVESFKDTNGTVSSGDFYTLIKTALPIYDAAIAKAEGRV